MASIFSTNEIRDYIISQGETSARATNMQTYVLYFEQYLRGTAAPNPVTDIFGKDPRLIQWLESQVKNVIDVALGTYGLGLNVAGIKAWIKTNRPRLYVDPLLSYLADAVYYDINQNLVDTPPAVYRNMNLGDELSQDVPTLSAKEVYAKDCEDVLTEINKYMRHFALNDVLDANNKVIMKGLLDLFPVK